MSSTSTSRGIGTPALTVVLGLAVVCASPAAALARPLEPAAEYRAASARAESVEELLAEFETAFAEYERRLAEAPDSKARFAIRKHNPAEEFLPEMRACAAEGEIRAGLWLLDFMSDAGLRSKERKALRIETFQWLVAADGEGLDELRDEIAERLFTDRRLVREQGRLKVEELASGLIEGTRDPERRAVWRLGVAQVFASSREEADVTHAIELLESQARDQAEAEPDDDTAQAVRDLLFQLQHLRVGCVAPDFEGETVDGETLRLADHRERVVVLSFFGFW